MYSSIPRSRFKTNVDDEYQTDERGNEHKSIYKNLKEKHADNTDNMRGTKKRNLISMQNIPNGHLMHTIKKIRISKIRLNRKIT